MTEPPDTDYAIRQLAGDIIRLATLHGRPAWPASPGGTDPRELVLTTRIGPLALACGSSPHPEAPSAELLIVAAAASGWTFCAVSYPDGLIEPVFCLPGEWMSVVNELADASRAALGVAAPGWYAPTSMAIN